MNNLVLGRAPDDANPTEWAFYETLGAGFGATAQGLHGGGAGAPGRAFVVRLSALAPEPWDGQTIHLGPGDRVIVETPGGGAWGEPL